MSTQLLLLFVYGEEGYQSNMKLIDVPGTSLGKEKRLTVNMYYAYQIHDHLNHYSLLPRGGRLFQQYVFTFYCSIEQSRIDYICEKKNDIMNEYLSRLYDAIMKDDHDRSDVGTRTRPPTSFTGGPRYMYAKSKLNGKLIYNSIINGPYVRRMIPEPSDQNHEVLVNETFHEQTDDELIEKELKQVEADDQGIQTILLGLPKDIYAAVDSCETAQEIWLRVQQMMKGFDIGIQEKKAKLFNEWEMFTSTYGELIEYYYHRFSKLMNDFKRNKHFPKKIANPTTAMNMALVLIDKSFKLNYSKPTNNNQRISSNHRNRQIAQPGMNMGQDRQMQMVGGNDGNPFRHYAGQNVGNQNGYNAVQNTQLLITQKEEAGIQPQAKEFDLMAAAADLDEIKEVNPNYILMANLPGTVDQHLATVEETCAYFESLYNNLAIKVEKDFKSLAKEADESLAKHKALELEINHFLRAIGLPKIDETHALSKLVTSNSVPTPQESKVMKNDNVIAPGMFRINPFKPSREEKYVPNKVRASVRTNPITVSQPHDITKKDVNSNSNGLSSTGVDNTAKTRRPYHRSNTKNDRVPSASKSSCIKNKEVEVAEHPRNLLVSNNKKHMSSECNNAKLAILTDKFKNLKLFVNFVWKFLGTVRFENDHVAAILGFDDLQWGNILITRTTQQNRVVERRNRTLVKAARIMLIFSHASLFLWAEVIATACYTQNCSIIHSRFNKTPYELIEGRKPYISFLHVFEALCYPKNDREDIGKLGSKGDIGFFIGYSADSYAYRVYNRRTKKIIDECDICLGLDITYASLTITTQKPTERELDSLFEAMHDDYIGGQPSAAPRTTTAAQAPPVR
nr:DNA helicase [Tanacetum cinerariifolium]